MSGHDPQPWWRSPGGLALGGFLLVGGFFLLTQHTAHVFGVLPFLLILACPLMHLFHHHGHGHNHHHGASPDSDEARRKQEPSP